MLRTFLALLGCQATGEVVRQVSGIPLSGSIIGLILLLAALMVQGGASDEFCRSGQAILGYLSLFLVPPGVGVMQQLLLLRAHWLPMLLALIVSTALAMVSGALVMQSVERLWRQRRLRISGSSQRAESRSLQWAARVLSAGVPRSIFHN